MSAPRPTDSDRNSALALLEGFRQRLLPGVLRRLAAWKGIPPAQLTDLREDVEQELFVDCLSHPGELLAMRERQRHARWMQLTERTMYRLRRHLRHCQPLVDEPWEVAEPAGPPPVPAPPVTLPPLVPLHNGRANVAESARRAGLGRRILRQHLDQLAERLGWNDERRRFWQARAAEALTGLAADQLRARHAVLELDPAPPPDLDRRLRRLQRLAQRFPVQPSTLAVRRALQPWLRRRDRRQPSPFELLQRAVELQPDRAAGWLWRFESCCERPRLREAATSLWRARRCGDIDRTALVLARARLLELRGREAAALQLLRRARRRRDPGGQLQRALQLAETQITW